MKTNIPAIFILFLIGLNDPVNSQDGVNRNLKDFNSLSVTGKMRVELYKSDSPSVLLEISGTSEDNIITEIKDSTLSLRLKTDTDKNAVIKVKVYYTALSEISVAANTLLISPETFVQEHVSFNARHGAKIELDLELKSLSADVTQGSILVFTGKVQKQDIKVNTGATYSAYKLKAEDTYVSANSGAKAKLCASRIIEANSTTKAYIGYIGTPVSAYIKTSLGGEIASFATEDAAFEN